MSLDLVLSVLRIGWKIISPYWKTILSFFAGYGAAKSRSNAASDKSAVKSAEAMKKIDETYPSDVEQFKKDVLEKGNF